MPLPLFVYIDISTFLASPFCFQTRNFAHSVNTLVEKLCLNPIASNLICLVLAHDFLGIVFCARLSKVCINTFVQSHGWLLCSFVCLVLFSQV